MANFNLKISNKSSYTQNDIDKYKVKLNSIFGELDLPQQPLLLEETDSNMGHHPHLWAKSSRPGASKYERSQ